MPVPLTFALIAFFIWIAENISTYLGAWQYPDQAHAWHIVSGGKITSWFLLVIISFIIMIDLSNHQSSTREIGLPEAYNPATVTEMTPCSYS